jgi:hypothetical protein
VDDAGDEDMVWRAKREESESRVDLSYCVLITWRVWCGRLGRGAMIWEGLRERPLGMEAVLMRREWRDDDDDEEEECADEDEEEDDEEDDFDLPGMSRMFSLRPVVGSVVWSFAGSCETW